jgi:outer membrane PBP1 activator LpoA protein
LQSTSSGATSHAAQQRSNFVATSFSEIGKVQTAKDAAPRNIAVLLPLSGNLGPQGNAIWQGILYAYYQMPPANRPTLTPYDLNQYNVSTAYDRAVADGADFVIGPLSKSDVENVADRNSEVTTLALNYSESSKGENFYEFGLSLRDDVRQIAEQLAKDGRARVITITNDDALGQTLFSNFSQLFNDNGGTIIDQIHVDSDTDLKPAIASALQVKTTRDPNSKKPLITRREDVDAIFLNVTPEQGRTIVPLLQYYYAGNVPVYATSLIYNGIQSVRQDYDLNKVVLTEMPWFVVPSDTYDSVQKIFAQSFPTNYKNYAKLYAVGIDAYRLAFQLGRLANTPNTFYSGVTGKLYMGANHQIYRQLAWGKFVKGKVGPW